MNEQVLLCVCVGGAVSLLGYLASRIAIGDRGSRLRQRLGDQERPDPGSRGAAVNTAIPLLRKLGSAASRPFMPADRQAQSSLRRELAQAGLYSTSAVQLVIGAKFVGLMGGLLAGYPLAAAIRDVFPDVSPVNALMLGVSLSGLASYLLPRMWLRSRIRKHQMALTHSLPDALDLMVVCVEAGLTIDAAIQRVGHELGLAHPELSRELTIVHMETRVGLSRAEALKNLGARSGNTALQSMAAMLIQAERFGTSIAGALRIHADSLRVKRQHLAEEMAAKASVKMSFPLVLFIFPATFIVLAGPTVIGLMNSSLFSE